MGPVGPAFKFWMELSTDHEGVLFYFHDFHELAVGGNTGKDQAFLFELRFELVIKFVAMAVSFIDSRYPVTSVG
jgi:hypothetical protein